MSKMFEIFEGVEKSEMTISTILLKQNVLRKEHVLIINADNKWKNEVEELEQEVDMQVSENDIW